MLCYYIYFNLLYEDNSCYSDGSKKSVAKSIDSEDERLRENNHVGLFASMEADIVEMSGDESDSEQNVGDNCEKDSTYSERVMMKKRMMRMRMM